MNGWTETALWIVTPYATLLIFVLGLVWRFRYDRFGWTTRSSQLYEHQLLRIASPVFHFGLLFVIVGHVVGLLVPERWTRAVGITEATYHMSALVVGAIAGICTLAGIALLIYRRRTTGPVFMATTRNDKAMYVVLTAAILAGLLTTLLTSAFGEHDYRHTVSPWFRGIFVFQPDAAAISAAPWPYKLHTAIGMLLFAIFPFTRLVHAFAAPLTYPFRPYIVYRSRSATAGGPPLTRRAPRGW
ncbi:respiratory nitrate reductase subunit gamma [Spongiactinospora rosea]|uniref:Nitrate reductase-like protein NarX n=1 Tax=Spongiactinospora rosea TaxID=2248750 RepID=A0A366LPI2_9ACTN|nr:respiratory nitrate reductase subunit gamma [Spongiactinospora rosea]RBQ15214.1 respiratory nitrate reductase subunit gamma [Spongiactinospora rosea]